jgi:hypothetical protein
MSLHPVLTFVVVCRLLHNDEQQIVVVGNVGRLISLEPPSPRHSQEFVPSLPTMAAVKDITKLDPYDAAEDCLEKLALFIEWIGS